MKPFVIWLAGFAVVFGLFAGIYHFVREGSPDRVLVIVDSSFAMEAVWSQVPAELDALDNERYAEYAIATEKQPIDSGWKTSLSLGGSGTTPFAPCSFDDVAQFPLVSEASEVVLITTPGSCSTEVLPDEWAIINLVP